MNTKNAFKLFMVVLSLVAGIALFYLVEYQHVGSAISFVIGVAYMFVVFAVIWPDDVAIWVAKRANAPTWLAIAALAITILSAIPMVNGFLVVLGRAFSDMSVDPVLVIIFGLGVLTFVVAAALHAAKTRKNPTPTAIPAPAPIPSNEN